MWNLLLNKLKECLKKYALVIMVVGSEPEIVTVHNVAKIILGTKCKDVLLLSVNECPAIWNRDDYWQISRAEEEKIIRLYYMYQFSDKFHVVSCGGGYNFPSMVNYLKSGILNIQDIHEVISYQINRKVNNA